jgi:hypothetical protein
MAPFERSISTLDANMSWFARDALAAVCLFTLRGRILSN